METKAATKDELWELWRTLAAVLAEALAAPHEATRPEMLNVARQFLKDNGINVEAGAILDARKALAELPSLSTPFNARKSE